MAEDAAAAAAAAARHKFNDINFRRFIIYTLYGHIAFTFNHGAIGDTVMRAGQSGAYLNSISTPKKTFIDRVRTSCFIVRVMLAAL